MAEENKNSWLLPVAGAAVVGLGLTQLNSSQEFQAESVSNLPAVVAQLQDLAANTDRRFDGQTRDLDRRIDSIQQQLSRRLGLEVGGRIEELRDRIADLEDTVDDLRDDGSNSLQPQLARLEADIRELERLIDRTSQQ